MNVSMRKFEANPGVRGELPLLVGIDAPSGGGKTLSALKLATGIQQILGGDIYGIDTENNRMLAYADDFKFQHVPFKPPFGSLDYLEAVRYCVGKGSRITIIDSATHEHIGQGGYLETSEAEITRIAGDDYKKREAVKMLGWAKAGPLRQKLIEGIKQLDGAFIFCYRAKEKTKPVRNGQGKTEVVDMGFMPIGGEELIYEMTVNIMLPPRSDGVPQWRSDHIGERLMMKLPRQFKHIFIDGEPLSEAMGRQMAEWAKGGAAPQSTLPAANVALVAEGKRIAAGGAAAFTEWWNQPGVKRQRAALKSHMDEFKTIAKTADETVVSEGATNEDPFGLPSLDKPADAEAAL